MLKETVQKISPESTVKQPCMADQKFRQLLIGYGVPFVSSPTNFEEQVLEYHRQRNLIGKTVCPVLKNLSLQMSQITHNQIKSGILEPLKDGKTGKIIQFIEI